MLRYDGMTQIGEWKLDDIDQIIRGLYINISSTYSIINTNTIGGAIPEAFRGIVYPEDPTLEEAEIFLECINSVKNFLLFLKKNHSTTFDNPPIRFEVRGNKVYLDRRINQDLRYNFKKDIERLGITIVAR